VLTLQDDDGAGEFVFAPDVYSATETNGVIQVTVARQGGAVGEASVDVVVSAGTAVAGEDFIAATGTLVFAASMTNRQFAVELLDDAVREDMETVRLALANPSAEAAIGSPGTATLNVLDNEDPNYDYYLPAYGKEGAELRQALHDIIDDHVAFSYDTLWTILQETDECPTNPAQVQLVYLQIGRDKNNNGGNSGQWNREHMWPQSHGFPDALSTSVPPSVDAHNLKPADVQVNNLRGEKDFDAGGESVAGAPPTCRTTADTFEPPDDSKGDVARAMFYMDVRYSGDKDGEPDLELVDAINTSGAQLGKRSTLIQWHFQDPPDDFEMRRNNLIYANWQRNRNPFIDHPEWVLKVWEYNLAIATVAGAGGRILPENPQVSYHSDQLFEVLPEPYWHVADIRTNGVSLGAAYGTSTYAFTWAQVVATGEVEAIFAPNLAPLGTPEWWLADYGFSNDFAAAETSDLDLDGQFAWQEFRANTRPDDPLSLLQFEAVAPEGAGGQVVLRWQSASNRYYTLWRSTNLLDDFTHPLATRVPADYPVNVYTDEVTGLETLFYRIEVEP
jgi:endonuclease I